MSQRKKKKQPQSKTKIQYSVCYTDRKGKSGKLFTDPAAAVKYLEYITKKLVAERNDEATKTVSLECFHVDA